MESPVPGIVRLLANIIYALTSRGRDSIDYINTVLAFASCLAAFGSVGMTYYLAYAVQRNLTDRRLLKDHLIKEILEVNKEYSALLTTLRIGKFRPKQIAITFQQAKIRVQHLDPLLNEFRIGREDLDEFHIALLDFVLELQEVQTKYSRNQMVLKQAISRQALQEKETEIFGVFNRVIVRINNSK